MTQDTAFSPDQLKDFLSQNDLAGLSAMLHNAHPSEIVDELSRLRGDDRAIVFRLLSKGQALDVFEQLDHPTQGDLVRLLQTHETAAVFEVLDPDDRVNLLDALPAKVTKRLLRGLSEREHELTVTLLGYPLGSVGRRMSPEYIAVHRTTTVDAALREVHENGRDADTVYIIPVVDDGRIVVGVLQLKELLFAEGDALVADLMESPLLIYADDAEEEAARRVVEADTFATAVVDSENRLIGLFTFDDAAEILADAEAEDAARTGGSEPLRQPYLSARLFDVVKSRVVWLFVLVAASTLTVAVQDTFAATLEQSLALALFIPMLIGAGGNIGAQAATTLTRALALGDVRPRDVGRVIFRELRVGLMLGGVLGAIGFIPAALLVGPEIALVLGLTVTSIGLLAATVGGAIPLLARAAKVDPAIVSAPFISTFVDATGLVIYFLIAKAVLGI